MDVARFDRWTMSFVDRRSALALFVAAGVGGLGVAAPAPARRKHRKKHTQKRCTKSERACSTDAQCCNDLTCADAVCCRSDRLVSECDEHCLCVDDENVCCAYEDQPPAACPGPASSPLHCCAAEDVCGDYCCNPAYFACDREKLTCTICKLPDSNDCPSGGGVYLRVRRVR
jgi:hypothetical protein